MNQAARGTSAYSQKVSELPNNHFAEQAALVKLLRHDPNWDLVSGVLAEEHFFHRTHRKIYQAMAHIANAGLRIGYASVGAKLQEMGYLPDEEVEQGLFDIWQFPMMGQIQSDVEVILAKSKLREFIGTAEVLIYNAYREHSEDVGVFLQAAETQIASLGDSRGLDCDRVLLRRHAEKANQGLDYIREHGHSPRGVLSGFEAIDRYTSGFHEADLIILAARPGIGKTTLSLAIAQNAVRETGKRVLFVSLEQPGEQLYLKLVSSIAEVDHQRLRTVRLTLEEEKRVKSANQKLSKLEDLLLVDDTAGLTVSELRSSIRNYERRIGPIDLVVIDYLQLMSSTDQPRQSETRALEVAQITRGLKHLAMDTTLPVIALSQLNRRSTERRDQRPLLSDLRESGSIEQDADLVLLLHGSDSSEGLSNRITMLDIHLAKHRHGPTGHSRLAFDGRHSRFTDVSGYEFDRPSSQTESEDGHALPLA